MKERIEEPWTDRAAAKPLTRATLHAPLALVIDDSPFLAQHLSRLLATLGLRPCIPSEADNLTALAAEAAVIFVELEQFRASGFELTRALAAQCSSPLVLLTGTGRNTDRQWGLRAGASAVLPRPLTRGAVSAVLDELGCGVSQ